jgi:O-antigen/teichoic acid export membrane protein
MGFFHTAAIGSALTFLTIPVAYLIRLGYARGLPVESFGLFYAIISLYMFVNLLATLGAKQGLGYLIPKYEKTPRANRIIAAAGTIRTVSTIIVSAILFVLAPTLETRFFAVEGAALALRIMVGWFIAHQIATITTGVFLGHRVVWAYAGYNLYRQVLVLIISGIVAVFFKLDLVGITIIWTITHAIVSLGYIIALRVRLPHVRHEKPDRSAYRELLSYSLPAMLVAGAGVVMSQIDTIMITGLRTIEEVAVYNVAYPTAQLLLLLATPVVMTILPEVSALYHQKKHAQARSLISTVARTMNAVSVLGAVLLATLAYPLLSILFDETLAASYPALVILSFGLAASGLASINLQALGAIGKVGRRAIIMNTAVGLNIVLNLILIYLYGYIGAAIATTITYVFLLILSVWELKRHRFETLTLDSIWRIGIPGILAIPVVLFISQLGISVPIPLIPALLPSVIISAGAGAIVYGITALITKGIRIEDITMLWRETKSLIPKRTH